MTATRLAPRLRLAALLPAVLVLACTGCGRAPAPPPAGKVSGQVFYQNQRLTMAKITFMGPNRQRRVCTLTDGVYTIDDLPAGTARILVDTKAIEEMISLRNPPAPELYRQLIRVPDQYADPQSSPLSFDVQSGDQNHDIYIP